MVCSKSGLQFWEVEPLLLHLILVELCCSNSVFFLQFMEVVPWFLHLW